VWRFPVIGLAAGLIGSLVGAGGGFLMVPLQVLWTRLPQLAAQGNSLAAIPSLALAGALVYVLGGSVATVDVRFAVLLSAGAIGGGVAGARWASRMPERTLKRVAAVVFLAGALKLMIAP